jgi:hypothetical protein
VKVDLATHFGILFRGQKWRNAASATRPAWKEMQLHQGELLRLEKASGIVRIEVKSGVLWVTGTPAEADILLKAGDQMNLTQNWPFILEGLEPASLRLLTH